jgi:REP element-mobilizing transposase RayT
VDNPRVRSPTVREGNIDSHTSMPKRDYIDFQTRTEPLAYLITFRCYGTWLHGAERGSVDRRHYHRYGTLDMPPNKRVQADEQSTLQSKPIRLNRAARATVESAIREVCKHRSYCLYAVNVRTNHVHAVVVSGSKPESVMNGFKAYATRSLRKAHLLSDTVKPWSRHGSTRYLWTEEQVAAAIEYVMFGQGDEPFH